MLVDCDHCQVRGAACSGCVVTVLLGAPPDGIEWDDTECSALGMLADSGLVPPLRWQFGRDGDAGIRSVG